MLDNVSEKDLLSIVNLIKNPEQINKKYNGEDIRIVILQRGWVMVGRFYQEGSECTLKNSYVIRIWGTSNGLGELAEKGPLEKTKLDKNTEVKFNELTVVASLICNEKKWLDYVK